MYVSDFVTDDLPASLAQVALCAARCRAAAETADQRAAAERLEREVAGLALKARIARTMWSRSRAPFAADALLVLPAAGEPAPCPPPRASVQ